MAKVVRDIDPADMPLSISPEKVCFIVFKARGFDVKDAASDTDPASNPSDDQDIAILEDNPDDPVVEEMTSLIDALSEDEQIDLVALTWLGRGDYSTEEWRSARRDAATAHNDKTANYLLGMPLLGDFLEEGLSMIGRSCEEYQADHL